MFNFTPYCNKKGGCMFVKPLIYTYENAEIAEGKNKLLFGRGPANIVWELNADKVYVYKFTNVVQVIGEWYEQGSLEIVTGVLNIRFSDKEMYKARFENLTASEITSLEWDDWFIYRIDKKEENNGENTLNYNETR